MFWNFTKVTVVCVDGDRCTATWLDPIFFCYHKISLFISPPHDLVPLGISGSWMGLFEVFLPQPAAVIPVSLIFCGVQHNTPARCGGVFLVLFRKTCRYCPLLGLASLGVLWVDNDPLETPLMPWDVNFVEVNQWLRSCSVKIAKEIFHLPQSWKYLPVRCSQFFFSFIKYFLDICFSKTAEWFWPDQWRWCSFSWLFLPRSLSFPRHSRTIIELMLDELNALMAAWLSERIAIFLFRYFLSKLNWIPLSMAWISAWKMLGNWPIGSEYLVRGP